MPEKNLVEKLPNANKQIQEWYSPSVFASILLMLTGLFYKYGPNESSFSISLPVLVYSVFIAVFIGALIRAFQTRRFYLVILNCVVALIACFFPFAQFSEAVDFHLNLDKRLEVVQMIKERKLSSSGAGDLYFLPDGCQSLSQYAGKVTVYEIENPATSKKALHVLFYTSTGLLGNYSGFEYSSDGSPPRRLSRSTTVKSLEPNWYRVSE